MAEHDDLTVILARPGDARQIAAMSRLLVEHGLPWRWTPHRVESSIRNPEHNVAVVKSGTAIAGFGIMSYGYDDGHLLLFAVRPELRRRQIGSNLLRWLQQAAVVAGLETIYLETRHNNTQARRFYRMHGYDEIGVVPGYYEGRESAVRMMRRLRPSMPTLAGRRTGTAPKPPL